MKNQVHSNVVALRPPLTMVKWEQPFSIFDQVSHSHPQYYVKPTGEVVREFPKETVNNESRSSPSSLYQNINEQNLQLWYSEKSQSTFNIASTSEPNYDRNVERTTAWFTLDLKDRESGLCEKNKTNHSRLSIDKREGGKNQLRPSCSEFTDIPLTDANEDHLMRDVGSHSSWNLALEEAVLKKVWYPFLFSCVFLSLICVCHRYGFEFHFEN